MLRGRKWSRARLSIIVPAAVVIVAGGAGIALATTSAAPASQFTVVNGTIRTATGTPTPASGTEAALWGNTSYATTTIDGSGHVLVGAIGSNCDGWPTISVTVDGTALGNASIIDHTDYGTYTIGSTVLAEGKHTVKIRFVNDYSRTGCDRNVAIGYARMETASTAFAHPGILESKAQLDLVKAKIAAGAQPWTAAIAKSKSSRFGKTTYPPHPVATIDCTADQAGCGAEQDDAIAAYTQALLWYYTGDRTYAQESIKIMNAWSSTMTGSNGDQAHLNHAWAAETFPRAAEIIRYTYTSTSGEIAFNVTAFAHMLTAVMMPEIQAGTTWAINSAGNWDLSMTEGQMNIAIFTDNHTLFNQAVTRWRTRVPAYIYLTSDGARPVATPGKTETAAQQECGWLNLKYPCTVPAKYAYLNGQTAETCRDISHTTLGLEAMVNGAETARIQGVDLYTEQRTRIIAGYEFQARYDAASIDKAAVPASLCTGAGLALGGTAYTLGWEIAYNQYAVRQGNAMPYTLIMVNRFRPTGAVLHMAFETLTHAGR